MVIDPKVFKILKSKETNPADEWSISSILAVAPKTGNIRRAIYRQQQKVTDTQNWRFIVLNNT